MQNSYRHPNLNSFILARACRRAALIENPAVERDVYAEPLGLVSEINDRTEAVRAAGEAYAMAFTILGHLWADGLGDHFADDLDGARLERATRHRDREGAEDGRC